MKGKRVPAGDRCLDATCWGRKADQHFEQVGADLVSKHPNLVIEKPYSYSRAPLPAFAQGRRLVESWKGTAVKKSDPGAVPVLSVSGDDRGKLRWMRFGKDEGAVEIGRAHV